VRRPGAPLTLCAALAALLGGCAMASRPAQPALASEQGQREEQPAAGGDKAEPQTIAAWEARIQRHAATLHALVGGTDGGGGGATPGTTTPSSATPSGPAPRAHARRFHPARPGPAPPAAAGAPRLSIRCQRICRHVRAICYAARRICQIAARLDDEAARAACQRNRKRCESARTVTQRSGCTGCGQARKRRKREQTRRACLR
jgi:hypothetical protein